MPLAARTSRAGPSPQDPKIRVHRVLAAVYRQYAIPAALGFDDARIRLMTPKLDTGAGPSIIRADALPKGWKKRLRPRPHFPHILDANKNPISARGKINLRLRSGGFATDVEFVVVKALDQALTRLGRADVPLTAKKRQFFQTSVEYLGHVIFSGEMHVHNKNLALLAKVGRPRTKTQLHTFPVMCNVYRRFVAKYARIAASLNQLTT